MLCNFAMSPTPKRTDSLVIQLDGAGGGYGPSRDGSARGGSMLRRDADEGNSVADETTKFHTK